MEKIRAEISPKLLLITWFMFIILVQEMNHWMHFWLIFIIIKRRFWKISFNTYAFHLSNFYNSQETIYSLHWIDEKNWFVVNFSLVKYVKMVQINIFMSICGVECISFLHECKRKLEILFKFFYTNRVEK